MTWTINLSGHDDLSGEEKEKLEDIIAGEAMGLYYSLSAQKGINITAATVTTNTFGSRNLKEV